jgi:hypothetical protein
MPKVVHCADRACRCLRLTGRSERSKNISEMRVEMDVDGRAITILDCRPPWREDLGSEWTRLEVSRLRDTKKTGTAPRGVTTAVLSGVPQRSHLPPTIVCKLGEMCARLDGWPGDPHQHWRRMVSLTRRHREVRNPQAFRTFFVLAGWLWGPGLLAGSSGLGRWRRSRAASCSRRSWSSPCIELT